MLVCLECGERLHPNLFNAYRRELGSRKSVHYHNDFICYNCHESMLLEIDDEIGEAIVLLNLKGYETQYCCAGHDKGEKSSDGYISFKEDIDVQNFTNMPVGWETEYAIYKRLNYDMITLSNHIIRYDLRSVNAENRKAVMAEATENLYKWVFELKDRNN